MSGTKILWCFLPETKSRGRPLNIRNGLRGRPRKFPANTTVFIEEGYKLLHHTHQIALHLYCEKKDRRLELIGVERDLQQFAYKEKRTFSREYYTYLLS